MTEALKALYTKVQKQLDKLPNLYLADYKEPWSFSQWEIKDFILQLLVSLSAENHTLVDKTGEIDSAASKRRSIGDIYRLCKYYYDNVTLLEVQYWLSVLGKENKVGFFYCNSVKKRVYMSYDFYKGHTVNPVQYASPDEYGFPDKDVKSLNKEQLTFTF